LVATVMVTVVGVLVFWLTLRIVSSQRRVAPPVCHAVRR
jgi:hypothetical protein